MMNTGIMSAELERLEAELAHVKATGLEYLPEYGYSPREEIIDLIEQDILDVKAEMSELENSYTDEELENERTMLCLSQGISRYC